MAEKREAIKKDKADSLKGSIIRETGSVCPICIQPVIANIRLEATGIYMEKSCSQHGLFRFLLSVYSDDYQSLSDCYFYFISKPLKQREYYVCASMQCNVSCPICFLDYCYSRKPLSINNLKSIIRDKRSVKRFTFSHGEPTVNPRLVEMITLLKKSGKFVNIHTNGIKLSDYKYTVSLKQAGLDHVSLQFDSFNDEAYKILRGKKLLDVKMLALKNLKILGITVTLNVTIARGVNDDEWGNIFDYVIQNNFIKDISYITYCHYSANQSDRKCVMMPDDMILFLEQHSRGRILRNDIICFQKLFYCYLNVSKKRKCFNYYHYLVIRTSSGYQGVECYLKLKKIAKKIDKCKEKKQKMTRKLLFRILLVSLKWSSLSLMPYGIFLLLRGGYPKKPGKFLTITLATICDPYKYDTKVAENCGQGIVTQSKQHDSYGSFIIEDMRHLKTSVLIDN